MVDDGVSDIDAEPEGVADAVGDHDEVLVEDGVGDVVREPVGVGEVDGVSLGLGLDVADAELLLEGEALGVGD